MDDQNTQNERFGTEESLVPSPPSLDLEVDDETIVELIKNYEKQHTTFIESEKIDERRRENQKYLFGKQLDSKPRKTYEKKIVDNVIKEGEDNVKPLVMSRLPDIIVKGGKGQGAKEVAENLTKMAQNRLTSEEMRMVLGMAFKHMPVDLLAPIKYRWDPHAGRNGQGDVVFEFINGANLVVDTSATYADQNKMGLIIHYVEKTVREWIMMFPKHEDFIKDYASKKLSGDDNTTEQRILGSKLKVAEAWFDWFQKAEDFDPDMPKFEFFSGVAWKLGDKLLRKMKNPNWDWEGQEHFYLNGDPVPDEVIAQAMMTQPDALQQLERKMVFRNYFKKPRKPFIFMSFEQWGDSPYEKTSRIEQNLTMQDNYDTRLMRITKMIDDARGKHVFSTLSGLKKETIEKMDLNNPDEDLVIDGDLRQVHAFIQPELPSSDMFADLERSRNRILAKVHVNPATRGEIQVSTATTNQIAREADFNVQDNLADETINKVAIQISEAYLHMIKLRATPEYFQSVLGEESEATQLRLTADNIEDGMVVQITASPTDKLKAERQAKEEAQLGIIDPYTYYKDTGRSDPEERVQRVVLYQMSPELYLKKYGMGEDVQQIAQEVQMFNQNRQPQAQGGQVQGAPQRPSPQDTTNVATTPQGSVRGAIQGGISRVRNAIGI